MCFFAELVLFEGVLVVLVTALWDAHTRKDQQMALAACSNCSALTSQITDKTSRDPGFLLCGLDSNKFACGPFHLSTPGISRSGSPGLLFILCLVFLPFRILEVTMTGKIIRGKLLLLCFSLGNAFCPVSGPVTLK